MNMICVVSWWTVNYVQCESASQRVITVSRSVSNLKSFCRAANAVFAKIGRVTSEEVTLQLIKVKCLPVVLYGLEACPLTKSDLQSLHFVINKFFMKLFTTKILKL